MRQKDSISDKEIIELAHECLSYDPDDYSYFVEPTWKGDKEAILTFAREVLEHFNN